MIKCLATEREVFHGGSEYTLADDALADRLVSGGIAVTIDDPSSAAREELPAPLDATPETKKPRKAKS